MRKPKWLTDARDMVVPPPADLPRPHNLVVDIETTPEANWTWGRYKQNIIRNLRPNYMLCFVYTWEGSGEYHFVGQHQDPKYKPDNFYGRPNPNQDRWVVSQLWHLFDMADIITAHNGDKFDIPWQQGREMYYHQPPGSPFATIDTLTTIKKHAKFTSNRLADLGTLLLNDTKKAHYGIDTWFGAMEGDAKMWDSMERYNLQDVVLLEELLSLLRPWLGRTKRLPLPNANDYTSGRPVKCPKPGCNGQKLIIRKHLPPTTSGLVKRQFECSTCGGYVTASYSERNVTPTWQRVK